MAPRFQGPSHQLENDIRSGPTRAQLRLVEPSEKQIVALNSVGQELRNARQAKGLEIFQVSNDLKISKRHLKAIEESDAKSLPLGDVYLLGYTRTYANYLGLNTRQYVEKAKSEIAEREAKCQIPMAEKLRSPSLVGRALRFLGLGSYNL